MSSPDQNLPNLQNEIKLLNSWNVYFHDNFNKNWDINSYIKIMNIDTNKSFWEFFNNFDNLNYVDNQFFIMKENISPLWEDLPNGANVIMRIKQLNMTPVLDIWTTLCAKILTHEIDIDTYHIKGIVFNMKYDLVNIKIIVDNAKNHETNEYTNTALFIKSYLEKEYPGNKYSLLSNIRKENIKYTKYIPRKKK